MRNINKMIYFIKKAIFKLILRFKTNRQLFIYSRLSLSQTKNDSSKSILLLAPEAGLKSHYLPLLQIGQILNNQGFQCFVTQCKAIFERCPLHGANKLEPSSSEKTRQIVCSQCINKSFYIPSFFKLKTLTMELLPEDKLKYKKVIKKYKSNLIDLKYDKIPFGKICEHDYRVFFKSLKFSGSQIKQSKKKSLALHNFVSSSLKNYLLIKKYLKIFKFKKVLYYNDYSLFLPIRILFERRGLKAFTVSHAYNKGIDRQRIIISKKCSFFETLAPKITNSWFKNPLPLSVTTQIFEDIIWRLAARSSFTYSPPFAQKIHKNNLNKQMIITAFSSSPDETSCLNVLNTIYPGSSEIKFCFGSSFENCQKEWLQFLKEFAFKNKEILIFFRIHPREFKNKREKITSEHFFVLKKALINSPKNLVAVWPNSKNSSYDIAQNSSLVLTAWSSFGYEMARLGLPLLTCTKGYAGCSSDEISPQSSNANQYEKNIFSLLQRKNSFSYMRCAFRWWHEFYLSKSIKLYDLSDSEDIKIESKITNEAKEKIIDKIIYGKSPTQKNRLKFEFKGYEKDEFKKGIAKVLYFLTTGIISREPIKIIFDNNNGKIRKTELKFEKSLQTNQKYKNFPEHKIIKTKLTFRLLENLKELES